MNKNPYANKYRTLYEIQNNIQDQCGILSVFLYKPKDYSRVYNKPSCNELGAIILIKDGSTDRNVDARVYLKSEYDLLGEKKDDIVCFPKNALGTPEGLDMPFALKRTQLSKDWQLP
ncbi:hypothetical protein TNCV_2910231 [Trichonephila clavipes]|nr:hypothetical protein TNCV_2910231 [Trichonephila clavipes]